MIAPETVECATCGGTAHRCAWGATSAACYRCEDCPCGGHILRSEAGTVVRQGGVFRALNNQQSRRIRA